MDSENITQILYNIKIRSTTDKDVNLNRECEVGHLFEEEIATLESMGYKVRELPSVWLDVIPFYAVSWDAETIPPHEQVELNVNNYTIHYKLNPMKPSTDENNHGVVTFRHTNTTDVYKRSMCDPSEHPTINSESVFGIEQLVNFSEADIKAMLIDRIKELSVSDLHRLIELSPGMLMRCLYSILNPDDTISLVDCRLDSTSKYIYTKE